MRTTIDLPAIAELIDMGGSISITSFHNIGCVAAANDGDRCLAMLLRRSEESLNVLLKRLDAAIVKAAEEETCIDEVNQPPPSLNPARRSRR